MDLTLWKKTKKERGLTYQDIARESGLPLGTIKNIFAGYTPDPRQSTITAIERALGVETRIIHADKTAPQLSADEQEMLQIYQSLSPAHRSQVLEYARYFAEKSGAATRRKA